MSNTDKYVRVDEEVELVDADQRAEDLDEPKKDEEKEAESVVDFHKLLQDYKARAENKLAYTIQQVDDVIFIDNKHIVALEYIFYARENGNYHRLVKQKVEKEKGSKDQLGLTNYSTDENNGNNAFQDMPRFYSVLRKNYINEHVEGADYQPGNTRI